MKRPHCVRNSTAIQRRLLVSCYTLALQDGGKPTAVVSSNAGHALWSGIAEEDKARTLDCLMGDSMFICWGVQTLSTDERRYNPMGYHLGTVWPHDNALIAAGFRRYGMSTLPHMHLNKHVHAQARYTFWRVTAPLAVRPSSSFRLGSVGTLALVHNHYPLD